MHVVRHRGECGGDSSLGVCHLDVGIYVIPERRVEFVDGRQLCLAARPVLVVIVLSFELRDAVLQVSNVLYRGLKFGVLVGTYSVTQTAQNREACEKGRLRLTCRIASLCISPVQAGIILLRSANSSFILLLRLLSIRLWAVFLAIFLPAALVALGCFFFPCCPSAAAAPCAFPAALAPFVAVVLATAPAPLLPLPLVVSLEPRVLLLVELPAISSCGGFIWMILRERVGGGGRVKLLSFPCCAAAAAAAAALDDRLRALTASAACIGYADAGGDGGELRFRSVAFAGAAAVAGRDAEEGEASWRAGGGSSNDSCREARVWLPSWPLMSEEDPGVGG